jgi:hypothetical protein
MNIQKSKIISFGAWKLTILFVNLINEFSHIFQFALFSKTYKTAI